jgi:hypothetical protein
MAPKSPFEQAAPQPLIWLPAAEQDQSQRLCATRGRFRGSYWSRVVSTLMVSQVWLNIHACLSRAMAGAHFFCSLVRISRPLRLDCPSISVSFRFTSATLFAACHEVAAPALTLRISPSRVDPDLRPNRVVGPYLRSGTVTCLCTWHHSALRQESRLHWAFSIAEALRIVLRAHCSSSGFLGVWMAEKREA